MSPALPILSLNRFSDDGLQAAIDKAMADLPADKQGAFVAHADTNGALTVSVVERIGPHISIKAGAIYPWGGKLSAGAEVVASW